MIRHSDDSGFTLIEVLVSFAMLSVAVITIYSAYAGGFSTIRASQRAVLAANSIQEKLASISSDIPLVAGVTRGETDDGISWQVVIEPFETMPPNLTQKEISAYRIVVRAQWTTGILSGTRSASYTTIRLKSAP